MTRSALSCLVSVSALALLTACGPKDEPRDHADQLEAEVASPPNALMKPRVRDAVALEAAPSQAPPPLGDRRAVPADPNLVRPASGGVMPVVAPSLAYEYGYSLELPADKARSQLTAHQTACEEAGPAVCQVIAAESYAVGAREAKGRLEMRATADWLRQFRARLEADAGAAGGKVLSVTTKTEDLTRSMVDTEAAIRSQQILQARMERLLAERTSGLSQAVDLEQQIAQTRAGIDAMRSSLEVMRARTAMQKLTIEYSVAGAVTPAPLKADVAPVRALKTVWSNILEMLAFLIVLASWLTPVALIVGGAWWLARRLRRKPPAAAMPSA